MSSAAIVWTLLLFFLLWLAVQYCKHAQHRPSAAPPAPHLVHPPPSPVPPRYSPPPPGYDGEIVAV